MKAFFQEYGKVIIAGIVGILLLVLLLNNNGLMGTFDKLKPANPEVRNDVVKSQLYGLENARKPEIIFVDPQLQLGNNITLSNLVLSAKDSTGADIKNKIIYYLEDGTEVNGSYQIFADSIQKVYKFRFYLEDTKGLYVNKVFAITVNNDDPIINQAEKFVTEWQIGTTTGTAAAKLFSFDEVQGSTTVTKGILKLEGTGRVQVFNEDSIPWKSYKGMIAECVVDPNLIISSISYWFKDCTSLERSPEFSPSNGVSLGVSTYEGCTKLTTGDIPAGVGDAARMFYGCSKLASIAEIPSSVTGMNNIFYNCPNLRGNLIIRAGVTGMPSNSFYMVASAVGGVPLRVFSTPGNDGFIKQAISDEMMYQRGSNVLYAGVK